MPGGWPAGLELCNSQAGIISSSAGVTVTGGAANTKGSYATLIAATAYDACWMTVITNGNSTSSSGLVDIALGAAGSEKVIANNLLQTVTWSSLIACAYSFPMSIPAGSRVSARAQFVNSSINCNVGVNLFDGAFTEMEGSAGVDSFGALTASSHGTTLTAGASANAKGSYVSMGIATRDLIGLIVSQDVQTDFGTSCNFVLDVAIGVGGSQKDIIPNLTGVFHGASTASSPTTWGPFFVPVPAGTNLWCRVAASISGSPQQNFALYGIYL